MTLGLGKVLNSMDPSRTPTQHLAHILIYCKVHLKRNFQKKFPKHEGRHYIINHIFTSETRAELITRMDSICQVWPELKTWIVHKKPAWIMCGLIKSESKIDYQYWVIAKKHTGDSESSHCQENNFVGRQGTLVGSLLG